MAIDRSSFDGFLAALDPDRTAAGERYERLRRRLLMFFAARRVAMGEVCADETLDRAARRLAEGVAVEPTVESYVLGIARNVAREQWKRPQFAEVEWARMAAPEPVVEDGRGACLESCLDGLAPQARGWIGRFYESRGAERIRNRAVLAEELGIDGNALRVRMCRIRGKLEECVRACLGGNETGRGGIS
jgi:DNA-directed RNA polymerase specialized sigma24 family protein